MAEIARQTFIGGPGGILLSLLLIGLVGWMASTVLSGLGKGDIARTVGTATVFICFGLVFKIIFDVIRVVFSFLQFS